MSPCGSMGILSKSDEQLSSLEQDSGQCSRNTSCETLGECWNHCWESYFETIACQTTRPKSGLNILMSFLCSVPCFTQTRQRATTMTMTSCIRTCLASTRSLPHTQGVVWARSPSLTMNHPPSLFSFNRYRPHSRKRNGDPLCLRLNDCTLSMIMFPMRMCRPHHSPYFPQCHPWTLENLWDTLALLRTHRSLRALHPCQRSRVAIVSMRNLNVVCRIASQSKKHLSSKIWQCSTVALWENRVKTHSQQVLYNYISVHINAW